MKRYINIAEKTILIAALLLFSCATTQQTPRMKEGEKINMDSYSVASPPGGDWEIQIEKEKDMITFQKLKKWWMTGSVLGSTFIQVFRNEVSPDGWQMSEEEVANDFRNNEEKIMQEEGVKKGLYEFEDVTRGITTIGGKKLYTMSYKTKKGSFGGALIKGTASYRAQETVLYLYFPQDFKVRHIFYGFLISEDYERGSLVKVDLTQIYPVINSFQDFPAGNNDKLPLEVFDQAVSIIERNYIDVSRKSVKLDTSKRPDMTSLISQLSPRSKWISAEEAEIATHKLGGEIGAEVRSKDSSFEIFNIFANSPAQHAGLHRGDKIIEINNEPVARLSMTQVKSKLQGAPETEVVLKVVTKKKETKVMSIIRKMLRSGPPVAVHMIENKVGYMRITQFRPEVPSEADESVHRLLDENMQGLVLDLRLNSGGLLTSVIETAQLFLKQGEIICTLIGKGDDSKMFKAQGSTHHTKFPLIVLIDSATESGAEIIAAALKENNRALLVGEKTLGSSEMLTVFPLKDGSGLVIRTAFTNTPAGERIEGRGIKPDREVILSGEEKDALYDRINSLSNANFEEISSDIQLKTALALLRDQIESSEQLEKQK